MTKENSIRLFEYYKKIGREDLALDIANSFKKTYGSDLVIPVNESKKK